MKQSKIGIIIIHYGNWAITKACLDSLVNLQNKDFFVYVALVDNYFLKDRNIKRHRIINKYIKQTINTGFARGNNIGIKACLKVNCTHILLLNNDTIVEPDFLQNLLNNQYSNNTLLGPVIEHKVGHQTLYDYGGVIDWPKCQPKHINKKSFFSKGKPLQRDFVSGCCLLMPAAISEKLNGFDESFFMYLEDVDLCLRAAKLGYKTYLIPQAKIFHKGSQSATEFVKIVYSLKNIFKLIVRHCPKKYWLSAFLFNLFFYPALYLRWQGRRIKKNLGL